jgi:thiol-disulfide isomerase/thioredoxin
MKIGSVVPDFILNDLNGDAVQLSQILKERTLILFWASWCSHCISTIPGIKGWQQTHNSENVEIITIALDTSVTDWHKQVGQLSIESWFNLSDLKGWDGKVTGDYNVYATPTMFLINQDQKIIAKPITLQGLLEY